MKKALPAALLMLVLLMSGCTPKPTFSGSRIKNEDCYLLDCSAFTGTDGHTIALEREDVLNVSAKVQKGVLKIAIAAEDGEPLYRSDGVETSEFALTAQSGGDYRISLEGNGFAGSIALKRTPAKEG